MIMSCLVCGEDAEIFHRFEKKALFNKAVERPGLGGTTPMEIAYCEHCHHLSSRTPEVEDIHALQAKIYQELYGSYAPPALSKVQTSYTEFLAGWLADEIGQPGVAFEVGSHDGFFLKLLKDRGWHCRGLEPSPNAKIAEEKYGIETINSFFQKGVVPENAFDLVIAKHVVEHVSDPAGFARDLSATVKDGGYLYLEVPNSYQSLQEKIFFEFHIDHISYFSIPSLLTMMDNVGGFEPVHVENTYAHMRFPFVHALFKKTGKTGASKRRWLTPFSMPAGIRRFKEDYERLQRSLEKLRDRKIGLWGTGSVGTQYAIDGQWRSENVTVVDPAETNHGRYLSVTGFPVFDPKVLLDKNPELVVLATGWENDALHQAEALFGGRFPLVTLSELMTLGR